jgi:hypothetical protein
MGAGLNKAERENKNMSKKRIRKKHRVGQKLGWRYK